MLANSMFDVPSQVFCVLEFHYYTRWFENGDLEPFHYPEDVDMMKREMMVYLVKKVKELDEARVSEMYYKWRTLTLGDGWMLFLELAIENSDDFMIYYPGSIKSLERQ